ncbi:MAG: type II toxin-antitoxin system HigB family toxin [Bacteroidota bacterium]
MIVLIKRTLSEFAQRHPTAAEPLNKWYEITKSAEWGKLADIKKVFNNVDYVGNDFL